MSLSRLREGMTMLEYSIDVSGGSLCNLPLYHSHLRVSIHD